MISEATASTKQETLKGVWNNFIYGLYAVRITNGAHTEHLQ